MIQRRASQSTHMDSSNQGDNDLDMDIVSDVLGSRSRHKKGFGSLPRLKAFGGKRARTSASINSMQQDHIDRIIKEHGQLRQYTTAQHEFLVQQMQDMNEMKKLFQQIQGLVPGLSVPEHLLSMVQPPPPPPVIFDDASTKPFESVHEEDDGAKTLD